MGRCRLVTLVAIMVATAVATSVAVTPPDAQAHAGPTITVRPLTLDVVDGPEGDQRIRIDASLYLPSTATAARPAPVVVLTHGFGGSKDDVDALARQTAHAGYVAMAYSARGFGRSTGTIGLAAVDYDVADVSQLIDALAEMPEVLLDGPGDPRVGFTGRSYGGGITLMAATADPRIDAIAPRITWSSLDYSLGPNNLLDGDTGLELAGDGPAGILKLQWATFFFGLGALQSVLDPAGGFDDALLEKLGTGAGCLGFVAEVCRAYLASVAAGEPTPATVSLLEASSPLDRLDGVVDVPTFLIQGENDTLFNLTESLRSARALREQGAPVKVLWHSGGHSGPLQPGEADEGLDPDDIVNARILTWWDRWLGDDRRVDTGPAFEYTLVDNGDLRYAGAPAEADLNGDSIRYLSGVGRLVDDPDRVASGTDRFHSPALGFPAAYSETSAVQDRLDVPAFDVPGQHVAWDTSPFPNDTALVGVPRLLDLPLASGSGETWFFAKLYDVAPDGRADLIRRQVSAVRADDLSAPLDVALPGLAHVVEAGHRLRLVLASTDLAYANRRVADTYRVTIDAADPPRLLLPLGPLR